MQRSFDWARPQVLRGAAAAHFDLGRWSLEALCNTFGDAPITLRKLPLPGAPLVAGTDRTCTSTVRKYTRYLEEAPHPAGSPLLYWQSQTLHDPPFDALLAGLQPPPPFLHREDFLSRWRSLRLLAPPLLHFIFAFRWLFIGPAGSYSRLHLDPAGSAAWNACLHGRKRFVFFPPESMHGLHEDLSDPQAAPHLFPDYLHNLATIPHRGEELLVEVGDVVYAPPRWPHFVENLDECSVSLTENFVRSRGEHLKHFEDSLASAEDPTAGLPPGERRAVGRFRRLVALAAAWDRLALRGPPPVAARAEGNA